MENRGILKIKGIKNMKENLSPYYQMTDKYQQEEKYFTFELGYNDWM